MLFRSNVQAEHGSNPLRMGISVRHSKLLRRHEQREDKDLLFDLPMTNPYASSNLEKEARGLDLL